MARPDLLMLQLEFSSLGHAFCSVEFSIGTQIQFYGRSQKPASSARNSGHCRFTGRRVFFGVGGFAVSPAPIPSSSAHSFPAQWGPTGAAGPVCQQMSLQTGHKVDCWEVSGHSQTGGRRRCL